MPTRSMSVALFLICALFTTNVAAFAQTTVAENTPSDTRVASLGLSIVTNPDAGVTVLTRAQVASIFSGAITNWKQAGGANLPIAVIAQGPDSAAQIAFNKVYLRVAAPVSATTVNSDVAALQRAATTSGAITFAYDSDATNADGVAIVAVSDVRTTDVTGLVNLSNVGATTAAGAFQTIGTIGSHANAIGAIAPTQAGTDSMEAHSLITRDFIDENASPIAEFTRIATIAPSVTNTGAVNGPGLSEQKLVIRGMGNDFTNLTFDGIPVNDTNDPSYHSTSFFPELIVGGVDVVRGPGFASDMGYATFGGSENVLRSRPRRTARSISPTQPERGIRKSAAPHSRAAVKRGAASLRRFRSRLERLSDGQLDLEPQLLAEIRSADRHEDAVRCVCDVERSGIQCRRRGPGRDALRAHDVRTKLQPEQYSGQWRVHRLQLPDQDDRSRLPALAFGSGRRHPPRQQRLHVPVRQRDDRCRHRRLTSTMAAAGTFPSQGTITCVSGSASCTAPLVPGSLASNGLQYNPLDIGGYLKRNKYQVVGDIFELEKAFGAGDSFVRTGVWLEHSSTDRHQYSVDLSNGLYNYVNGSGCLFGAPVMPGAAQISGATNPTVVSSNCAASAGGLPAGLKQLPGPSYGSLANGVPIGAVKFDQQSQILNAQPFLEVQWVLPTGTTIYPGVSCSTFSGTTMRRFKIRRARRTRRTASLTTIRCRSCRSISR